MTCGAMMAGTGQGRELSQQYQPSKKTNASTPFPLTFPHPLPFPQILGASRGGTHVGDGVHIPTAGLSLLGSPMNSL